MDLRSLLIESMRSKDLLDICFFFQFKFYFLCLLVRPGREVQVMSLNAPISGSKCDVTTNKVYVTNLILWIIV